MVTHVRFLSRISNKNVSLYNMSNNFNIQYSTSILFYFSYYNYCEVMLVNWFIIYLLNFNKNNFMYFIYINRIKITIYKNSY